MRESIAGASLTFRCRVVDVRELDGDALLGSPNLEDNLIAILMRLRNQRVAVQGILKRIAESDPARREVAVRELIILAGLRRMGAIIKKETKSMPILDDIMDHDLLGPAILSGLQQGREEGREEGRVEGEQTIVMRLIEKRFGTVPAWARERLAAMSVPDVEETALRLLDARSLEELLGQ